MDRQFNLNKIGNTESLINLTSFNDFEIINSNFFIKNYKISNLYRGKYFIKRLIKKVFKYKLKTSMKWEKFFWIKIEIIKCKVNIKYDNKNLNNNNFQNIIYKNYSINRYKDILKLKDKISNRSAKLDYPLFISGDCLNLLGSEVLKDDLFMLDGSRRINAYLLSNINKINIYIINLKSI